MGLHFQGIQAAGCMQGQFIEGQPTQANEHMSNCHVLLLKGTGRIIHVALKM